MNGSYFCRCPHPFCMERVEHVSSSLILGHLIYSSSDVLKPTTATIQSCQWVRIIIKLETFTGTGPQLSIQNRLLTCWSNNSCRRLSHASRCPFCRTQTAESHDQISYPSASERWRSSCHWHTSLLCQLQRQKSGDSRARSVFEKNTLKSTPISILKGIPWHRMVLHVVL